MTAARSTLATVSDRQRRRLLAAQAGWIVKVLALPIALLVVLLTSRPAPDRVAAILVLLGVASSAWVIWLVMHPRRSGPIGSSPALWILFILIVASSGIANELGAHSAAMLTVIATANAAITCDLRLATTVSATAVVALIGSNLFFAPGQWQEAAFASAIVIAAAGVGIATGLRIQRLHQTLLLLEQQKQITTERERAAALAERSRIAREIHDILAHSLADLSIQLELADALLTDSADASGAVIHIRRAHRIASEGLTETRRAIQALRNDSPPLPDALAVIAAASRAAGRQVGLVVTGKPRTLEPAASLSLLRAAQESLGNAAEHAAGSAAEIRLQYDSDRVLLTVTNRTDDGDEQSQGERDPANSPDGTAGGYGLAGMRERLLLVGGSLSAGPIPGGWSVNAEVPA